MVGPFKPRPESSGPLVSGATRRTAIGLVLGAPLLGACAGVQQTLGQFSNPFASQPPATPSGPAQQPVVAGNGQVKVGLLLPLSASGNAAVAAQSMRNSAEMALAEFQNPNIQLLIKDDGGNPQGAAQGTQQALDEGAEIMLGPLFAQSVPATAQVARAKGVSCIAFSTDSNVAGRGIYLLSFLPESDVNRIVEYSASIGKKSFAALLPDNAYGGVVEAAFKQAVPRRGGRIVAFEKYGADRATAARTVAQALGQADALLIADDGEFGGGDRGRAHRGGREFAQYPVARYRAVGQSAGVRKPGLAGRSVCCARPVRLPRLRRPLPHEVWLRAGTHGNAHLRRGRAGRGAGTHARPAALLARCVDEPIRLCRHRWAVPLPPRRHQ